MPVLVDEKEVDIPFNRRSNVQRNIVVSPISTKFLA